MTDQSSASAPAACRHPIRESLDAYVNGSLGAEEIVAVREHLAVCAGCASETDALFSLAAAIERHGAEPAAGRPRWQVAIAALAAAAAVVLGVTLVAERARLRQPAVEGTPADSIEVRLDLGSGPKRGAPSAPVATLTKTTLTLRITLAPPVQPNARYSVRLVPPESSAAPREAPLGERDAMGRAVVILPADAVRQPGSYRLEVREVAFFGRESVYLYPFDIRLAGEPSRH
jgi:hypothetical protein